MTKDAFEASPAKNLLGQKEAGADVHPPQALDHLAVALILSTGGDVLEALGAIQRLRREFVDWNEIRVARVQEIARALGDFSEAEKAAERIKEEYNAFFDKKGVLSFEFLAAGKPAEARRHLNQVLPHIGRGAVALLLYEFCPGAQLPLTDDGLRQARKDGIVGKTADRNQVARALNDCLSLSEAASLVQYWELEATGSPYGEHPKKDAAGGAKKAKKPAAKAKAKVSSK